MKSEERNERNANQLDGKRGWVVTAACFMAAFLTDGIFFCYGLVVFEMIRVFDEPVKKVAWVPSLLLGIQLLSGTSFLFSFFVFLNYSTISTVAGTNVYVT